MADAAAQRVGAAQGEQSGPRAAVAGTASQRARRQRIVRAALELLEQRDYERIQIRDVAERADVALGTLYRYFPSKEQLFANVLLEWSQGFDTTVRRRRTAAQSDAERLLVVLRRAVGAFERRPGFFRLITTLEVVTDPDVVGPFRAYSERFNQALADALQDVAEDDVPVVTAMAAALVGTLLRGWTRGNITIDAVYDQLDRSVDIIFRAPRPR